MLTILLLGSLGRISFRPCVEEPYKNTDRSLKGQFVRYSLEATLKNSLSESVFTSSKLFVMRKIISPDVSELVRLRYHIYACGEILLMPRF